MYVYIFKHSHTCLKHIFTNLKNIIKQISAMVDRGHGKQGRNNVQDTIVKSVAICGVVITLTMNPDKTSCTEDYHILQESDTDKITLLTSRHL